VCAAGGVRFAARRCSGLASNWLAPLLTSASDSAQRNRTLDFGKDQDVMSCMQHTFCCCCYLWTLPHVCLCAASPRILSVHSCIGASVYAQETIPDGTLEPHF
jgi:hypothetical protein